jgi:hypothetical protein
MPPQTDTSTTEDKTKKEGKPPVQAVIADPKFHSLPFSEKMKVLQKIDPAFAALDNTEQNKVVQRLNPDFVRQSKSSSFALGTSQEGREAIEPTKWGVTKWIMKETGLGMWDAAKGVRELISMTPEDRASHPEIRPGSGAEALYPFVKAGKGLFESLKKAPEAVQAIRDIYNNPYGPAAVAEQVPRAAGQYAGAELGGKIAGKVAKLPDTVIGIKEKGIQPAIQDYVAGVGPSAAEDLVKKTREDRAADLGKIREKNARLQAKYDEDVKNSRFEREKAEKEHAAATDQAQKKHLAEELEKKQAYEKRVVEQKEDFEKKVARQERAHEKLTKKIESTNAQKMKDHAEETKRIEEVNKAEEERVGKRAELAGKIKGDSSTLGQQLHSFYSKAKARGKALYAPVDKATEGMSVPASQLGEDVIHAEDNILRGSEENIKQFRDILKRSESETDPTLKEDEGDPRGFSYDLSREMGGSGEPITFHDLQGYYSELGKKLYGTGSSELLGDVKAALQYVRKEVGKKMVGMAKEAGVEDELKGAMDFHSQMQATFNDMSPVQRARNIGQRAGSPVARAIRAVDPQYIRDPFLNPAYGDRAVALIKAYEDDPVLGGDAKVLAGSIEGIRGDFKTMNDLPKKAKVEAAPEAPKLSSLPEKKEPPEPPRPIEPPKEKPFEAVPYKPTGKEVAPNYPKYADDWPAPPTTEALAKELKERKGARVSQKSRQFTEMNKWDAIALGYGVKEVASGELPKAWAYVLGHYGMGKLMKVPKVNSWLTEVTPADMAILDKLYEKNPGGKAEAQAAITQILQASGKKPSPGTIAQLSKFLTKPQVQSIIQTGVKTGLATGAERGRKSEEDAAVKSHTELLKGLDELDKILAPQSP